MRIGLLSNLRAGHNERRVSALLDAIVDFAEVSHLETSSAGAVPDALWDFASQDVELLVVNGGDGTLQAVLTEILESRAFDDRVPLIAPLRGGRTNMTALDLGAQRHTARAVAQLVTPPGADRARRSRSRGRSLHPDDGLLPRAPVRGHAPFWGQGDGGVHFTSIRAGAPRLWRAAPRRGSSRVAARVCSARRTATRAATRTGPSS